MMSDEQRAEIYNHIIGHVNGCPGIAVRSAIDTTLLNWIRDVRNLTHVCGPITIQDGQIEYDVCAPFCGRVLGIRKLFSRFGLLPVHAWTAIDCDCGKKVVFRSAQGMLGMSDFSAQIEWAPTKETDELPDAWFQANKEGIVNGVLRFLLGQASKPWGDVHTAAYFAAEFEKNKIDAIYATRAEGEAGGQLSAFDPQTTFAGIMF